MNKKEIGSKYENIAKKFLEKKEYKILEMNYRNFIGEIDIIARDADQLIFVEVKARKTKKFGLPREAITYKKIDKIRKCSLVYMKDNKIYDCPLRFDVVEVYINEKKINHIINAF
jgi:putative endonuclease